MIRAFSAIRRRRGDKTLTWGLTLAQVDKLNKLQTDCLRKISGAFGKTAGEILEKELFVENLHIHLYRQACVQRAKVILSEDVRWRSVSKPMKKKKKKTGPKNPLKLLDQDAAVLVEGALLKLDEQSKGDEERDAASLRWADETKRNKTITSWSKELATRECQERWEDYIKQRRIDKTARARPGAPVKLPASLAEPWGKESFDYYGDMLRPQSTIMLQCRAAAIGLNHCLFNKSLADSPHCPCQLSRETPFHLFVECNRLQSARRLLVNEVGHNDFARLLTKDAKVAAEWAISYFELEQLENTTEDASRFPRELGTLSQRRRGRETTSISPRKSPTSTSRSRTTQTHRQSSTVSPGERITNATLDGIQNSSTPGISAGLSSNTTSPSPPTLRRSARLASKTTPPSPGGRDI